MRGWIEWFAKGLWRRRRPIEIFLALTIAFTALVLWQNRNFRPAPTMHDPSFVKAANSLCLRKVKPLAEKQRTDSQENNYNDTPGANAVRIDSVADKLTVAVADLRALPHRPENTAKLNAWFGEFDTYIKAGRDYAAALRTNNARHYNAVASEGVAPLKAISAFGRANHLDACIP